MSRLIKLVNDVDPHVLEQAEIARLWRLRPGEIATEALGKGEFRERRLILEALAVRTDQRLATIAACAAVVALLVPVVEKGWADALLPPLPWPER